MMDAEQVKAYVAAKWPDAMQSPLAQAVQSYCAADQADRAIGFAGLQAKASAVARKALLADAAEHAESCLNACDGWTVESLGHNIESAFGSDLDAEECDEIAKQAIARSSRSNI